MRCWQGGIEASQPAQYRHQCIGLRVQFRTAQQGFRLASLLEVAEHFGRQRMYSLI